MLQNMFYKIIVYGCNVSIDVGRPFLYIRQKTYLKLVKLCYVFIGQFLQTTQTCYYNTLENLLFNFYDSCSNSIVINGFCINMAKHNNSVLSIVF